MTRLGGSVSYGAYESGGFSFRETMEGGIPCGAKVAKRITRVKLAIEAIDGRGGFRPKQMMSERQSPMT